MAHEVETMAWQETAPWHGLGNQVDADASLDEWIDQAGFNWELRPAEIFYRVEDDKKYHEIPDRVGLVRSDNNRILNIASPRYKVVQPRDVAEFFREFTELAGFRMETMGVLKGGAIYWGLAKIDDGFTLGGKRVNDRVEPYMLLATSCDGSMSTVAHLTSVRVVCMNTLQLSVGPRGQKAAIRVPHSLHFNPDQVKADLGLVPEWWAEHKSVAQAAARFTVDDVTATQIVANLYAPLGAEYTEDPSFIANYLLNPEWELGEDDEDDVGLQQLWRNRKLIDRTLQTMEFGPGQDLKTAKGTLWGVLGGVTRYWDHEFKERVHGHRLANAWFHRGSDLKTRAYDVVRGMVA